jgi:hypothetical protein
MMEQMALKDFNRYQLAAQDHEVGGGVTLPNLLNDEAASDEGANLMAPLIPEAASTAKMAIEQQDWPIFQATKPSAASATLVENMKKLALRHDIPIKITERNSISVMDDDDDMIPVPWPSVKKQDKAHKTQEPKITATPWPLPSDYEEGDPLPKAPAPWCSSNASKELFNDAKPTPPTQDWEARLREKEEKEHKANVLHHQFWNPTHEDYNPERFYDPMIEKYKCPFPGCE